MEGIKEAGLWILSGIVALLGWIFKRQIRRIDELHERVNVVEDDLRINTERDQHMDEAVKEIREGQKETQGMIHTFLEKYAFVLDKMVKQEMEK